MERHARGARGGVSWRRPLIGRGGVSWCRLWRPGGLQRAWETFWEGLEGSRQVECSGSIMPLVASGVAATEAVEERGVRI